MKILYNIYRIIRTLLVTALSLVIGIYVILYVVLSIPAVQRNVKSIGEEELSKLLHTQVTVGRLNRHSIKWSCLMWQFPTKKAVCC